ncbi:GGDEF domain-containing protein [Solidesulfovibrio sp.]|uniref:GGDEF domain-containing protein n=1 Tax=Solidesulfovibrio sp. TaxID=2910990 RepID=UPI002B201520|nr:diguanylate cyclase [Solidesulfovibrio sp.]MEA4858761.1 diguanylate cyclase [Solidesulfovibrio sp.]
MPGRRRSASFTGSRPCLRRTGIRTAARRRCAFGPEYRFAECLRVRTERDLACVSGHPTSMTIAIGVVTHVAGHTDFATVLKEADAALYEAKRLGRNRVIAACGHPSRIGPGKPVLPVPTP